MCAATSATVPLEMAMSRTASMRFLPSITRPPLSSRSYWACAARHSGNASASAILMRALWEALEIQFLEILKALAERVDRVAGSLVLLDEVVLHTGFGGGSQDSGHVDHAVADFAECGLRDLFVVALVDAWSYVLEVH